MTPPREPSLRDLRYFGVGLLVLLSFVAWRLESTAAWAVAAVVGGTAAGLGAAAPSRLAPAYRAWMLLFTPVGKAVTWCTLAVVFFGVLTPIAWAMRSRLARLLPLERDASARTYWIRDERAGRHRPFRQF